VRRDAPSFGNDISLASYSRSQYYDDDDRGGDYEYDDEEDGELEVRVGKSVCVFIG
jgi:ATP-binding cassette, subfamily B (MDR/TAP), member 1